MREMVTNPVNVRCRTCYAKPGEPCVRSVEPNKGGPLPKDYGFHESRERNAQKVS